MGKPPAAFDELRNLAIGALALPDLRPSAEWLSNPVETGWNSAYREVDPSFRFDAVTNPNGDVSLRRVGTGPDDRGEIARIPGFKTEARPRWSPDGRFLAVWHFHLSRLQVWRADGPTPTLMVNETNGCRAFGFSPSGDKLITARDGLLRVYDPADGRIVRSFPIATEAWENVGHHPRLPQVALARAGGVLLVDLETGKEVGRLPTTSPPEHLTWHPDGELLAFVTAAHVQVWDVPRKRLNWELEHRGGGLEIAFNPTGDLLTSCGWAGRLKLWNPYTGRSVFGTTGWAVRFGSGERLATTNSDFWKGDSGPLTRVEAGREYRTLVAGAGRTPQVRDYRSCSVHPDGRLLAVGTPQGISLMDLATGSEREYLAVPADVVLFEPTGSLLTNTRAGLFRWPVRADPAAAESFRVGPPERVPCATPHYISRIAQSRDGTVLAGSNPHATGAFVWHRDSPGEAIRLTPHADCRNVAVSPDGRLVATGTFGGLGLKVWNAANGKFVREFLPDDRFTAPFFSADGRWLMSSGGQSWRDDDWTEGPRHIGGEAAFSADKRLMAWGGHKGFIPLVDPESGRELARLEDPSQDVLMWLTFSPDGTLLIGSTDDSSCVRVWNLRKIRDGLKELGLDWDAKPYPPDTSEQRPKPIHIELVGAEKLITPAEPPGLALNNEAWRLVAGPPEERNPAKALVLVRQALDREPVNRLYLNTLGVAEYRCGRYQEAIAALDKSLAGGDGEYAAFDLYFLAMCHARLGDLDKARDSFDRAVKWHEKKTGLSAIHAAELSEFRAEAKAILESDRQSRPPPGGGKP